MPGRVSVALIVRDEAQHLTECLEGLGRFADEICLVDTGSTDGTPDVALSMGVTPVFFPWDNDFSHARNRSLELCTLPWIFIIDADERLDDSDLPGFRALVEAEPNYGYRFVTRNYTDRTSLSGFHSVEPDTWLSRGFPGWYPSTKVRLFPNRPDIRFEGEVHELVNPSIERAGLPIVDCNVPIHHYPLLRDSARIRQKQDLYLELGRLKASREPESAKAHRELGHQLVELGNRTEALECYRRALQLAPHDLETLRSLGNVLHLMARQDEAERALRLALRIDPHDPETWRNLGVVEGARGCWAEAAGCFEHAIAFGPEWSEGWRYLSVALRLAGRYDEAREAACRALEALPEDPACLENFLDQMAGRSEARPFLEHLIQAGADAPQLRDALKTL